MSYVTKSFNEREISGKEFLLICAAHRCNCPEAATEDIDLLKKLEESSYFQNMIDIWTNNMKECSKTFENLPEEELKKLYDEAKETAYQDYLKREEEKSLMVTRASKALTEIENWESGEEFKELKDYAIEWLQLEIEQNQPDEFYFRDLSGWLSSENGDCYKTHIAHFEKRYKEAKEEAIKNTEYIRKLKTFLNDGKEI